MATTRSMTRKKSHDDASSKKRIKTCDHWSELTHDVLLLVMMKLAVVDFLAFNRVCKSWRSLAVSNKNKFIVSKPPMSISISSDANEIVIHYYLEDFEGRKLKITLPHFAGRMCVGVTCGYLILFGKKTSDCWLVNLITRHELHFPSIPENFFCCPRNVRGILVFSPISGWVFVVVTRCYSQKIWFCIAGKREWSYVSAPFSIRDLLAFKGKIYTLSVYKSDKVKLCEMRLYPEPKLVLLKTENFPNLDFTFPGFVAFEENLYVIDRVSKYPYKIHELDLGEMKLVSLEKTGEKYAFFLNESKHGKRYPNYTGHVVVDKYGNGGLFYARSWYFFCDCLNIDLIQE